MFPRFALEAVGFGGVIIIILYLMKYSVNFNSIIPIIALYVFAGYRLLPAIQIIYASSSRLKFVGPALNAIYKEIEDTHQLDSIQIMKTMEFNKEIVLKEIDYTYPGSSVKVLNNININIKTGNTIGIIGTTGSGKTTLVDLILGLLKCQTGSIQIDNQIINENNIKSWQNLIGYVPQNIYLLDDTIVANIAFGVPNKDVDQSKIERVSKIAKLHEFVVNELPEKYLTKIGDRGIRLSGGQCQRIGIARALYDNPKLIIFDEATSALDNITESEVMSELNNLDKNITIILVAHRLATVKKCDVIYYLEKGEIKDFGNYQKLSENHVLFKNQKY
jgi:ABC-type bacteriocin/lantibiotic exporter with double-glycine peptidase domain